MAMVLFIAGLIALIIGAEALVRGASRLAALLRISPLVIGLTVVAFGTSSPEFAVSIKAVLSNQASLAVGNVVGSNIFNVLLILGLSALILPLVVSKQLVRLDVPLMIALSVIVLVFSLDEKFSRTDGLMLVTGLVIYVCFLFYQSHKESVELKDEYAKKFVREGRISSSWFNNLALILGGLMLLIFGSRWLVVGAVSLAQYLGVSELVVGLTIVAAGTSLPELATSVIAAARGERDIAVGNVIGSNLFNLMGVLGVCSIVAPTGIEVSAAVTKFDIPVMIVVAFACLPIFFTGGVISRPEGALLLGYYVVYLLYLILASAHHDALSRFSAVMLYFVISLTVVTIIIVAVRELHSKNKSESE